MPNDMVDVMGSGHPMPVFRFEDKWVQELMKMPETSMGYQDVNIHLKDGRIIREIVGNCEWIMRHVSFDDDDIEKLTLNR